MSRRTVKQICRTRVGGAHLKLSVVLDFVLLASYRYFAACPIHFKQVQIWHQVGNEVVLLTQSRRGP